MLDLIDRLLHGDQSVARQFAAARNYWEEFFAQRSDWTEQNVFEALSKFDVQYRYELLFDNRFIAKSTLPLTCLGTLYDSAAGFGNNLQLAASVAKALINNQTMSLEVKSAARRAARLYELDSHDEALKRELARF